MWRKVGRRWRKLQPQHWGPSFWAICEQLTAPAQLDFASFSGEKNRRKKLISQRSMKQVRAVQGRYSGPASQHSCIDLRTYNNCTTTRNQCQTTAMVLEHGQELYFIGLLQWFNKSPSLLTADGRLSTGPTQDKAVCLHRGLQLLRRRSRRGRASANCMHLHCSGRGLLQTAIQICNCLRDTYMASSFSQNKFLRVLRNIRGKCEFRSNWVSCVMFVHHVSYSACPFLRKL